MIPNAITNDNELNITVKLISICIQYSSDLYDNFNARFFQF